jgi:hypothetical protein
MRRNEWIYATDKQRSFLQSLAKEAFAAGWSIGFDTTDLTLNRCERLLKSEASTYIGQFLAAKSNGWK